MDLSNQLSQNPDPLQEVNHKDSSLNPVTSDTQTPVIVTDITPTTDLSDTSTSPSAPPVQSESVIIAPVTTTTPSLSREAVATPPPTSSAPSQPTDPKSNPLYEDPDLVILTK